MEEKPRIEVQWYSQEKRILHVVYHAKWDWEDYEAYRNQAKTLLRDNLGSISVLVEYDRDANLLPPNAIRNLSIAAKTANPSTAFVVTVAPSQFWRVVLSLLKRLVPHSPLRNSQIVRTREEALTLLEAYRETSRS